MNLTLRSAFSLSLIVFLLLGAGALTGCGIGQLTTGSTQPGTVPMQISGVAMGGETPISGATVQLWETSTSNYGGTTSQLVGSTTTALHTGAFTFGTANVSANCTAGPFAYITITGGDPTGNSTATTNSGIVEVAMIGSCSTTGSSTFVVVNELTTVAAAYALSGFAVDASGTINIGAPSSNAQGLKDAFANAALLVNTATGTANASSSTVELPTAMLNTLADALQVCVNTTSSSSSLSTNCSNLYTYTTPPGGSAPTDIFQSALNMAKYPGQNVASILGTVPGTGQAFQPTISTKSVTSTTAPNDLTLGIAHLNTTLGGKTTPPVGIAIDASDNVWVLGAGTASANAYFGELPSSSSGGAYYISTAQTAAAFKPSSFTFRNGAFDTSGNLWLSYKGTPSGAMEILPAGLAQLQSTAVTNYNVYQFSTTDTALATNDWTVALDASNNLWTASYAGQGSCTTSTTTSACAYVELKAASTYAPTDTFGTPTPVVEVTPTVRGIAADAVSSSPGKGNIWTANYGDTSGTSQGGSSVEVLNPTSGALTTYTVTSTSAPWGVALDAAGDGYISTYGTAGLYYVAQGTASGSISTVSTSGQASTLANIANSQTSLPASNATAPLAYGGLINPAYVAVDGAGNVWVGATGGVIEYSPSLQGYLSPYYGFYPSIATTSSASNQAVFTCSGSTTITCSVTNTVTASGSPLIPMAIDRAGSVWTMDNAATLLEIIGTAAPTDPVLADGKSGSLP